LLQSSCHVSIIHIESWTLSLKTFFLMSLIRDWFEDEVRAFQGGKDGLMPCVWDNEPSSFPLVMTVSLFLVDVRCFIIFLWYFFFCSYYSSCYVTLLLILDFILFLKPETINKMLVNQMLLCFGIMFASQVRGSSVWLDIRLSMF